MTTNLPVKPDINTGQPRPPAAPSVCGVFIEPTRRVGSTDVPPRGRGPGLEVYEHSGWLGLTMAGGLSVISLGLLSSTVGSGDPLTWYATAAVFMITLLREGSVRLVAGADWLRVNRKWVDTYDLTHIALGGAWFGWMLRLRDSEGRRVRVHIGDLEGNADLWALVHNGMAHSARDGAKISNLASGSFELPPGLEALRAEPRRPRVPDRAVRTFALVIAAAFGGMWLFRPDVLGPALMAFAVITLVVVGAIGAFRYRVRGRENTADIPSAEAQRDERP